MPFPFPDKKKNHLFLATSFRFGVSPPLNGVERRVPLDSPCPPLPPALGAILRKCDANKKNNLAPLFERQGFSL